MRFYPPGTRIAGRYEIASRPLIGGMGIVYVCKDLEEDRPVALKTFKPEYLPDRAARDRFLREGTAWVDLGSHPHIVRCYQVLHLDPEVYLVLELIAKEQDRDDASLRSWLIPGHPLPVEQALLFALQIARGMAHAAERIPGFVHRDLKPENVLVGTDQLSNAAINRLRVTDFGLAAVLESASERVSESAMRDTEHAIRNTQLTHGIVGTPLYMAPEQWNGEPVGVYTDVYALGCILYEMLTGQRAVAGRGGAALRRMHCIGQIQPLPESVPGEVRDVVARCLALDPGVRYDNWRSVEATLVATYEGVVTHPAPETPPLAVLNREECVQIGLSYNAIGLAYTDIGKAAVALGYFERALTVGQTEGNRELEEFALGNLGEAYRALGDARRAIEYQERSLAIAREVGNKRGEGAALGNLGLAYADLGDARRAIGYYEQQLVIIRKIRNRRGEGNALVNLGIAYYSLGQVERAIEYYTQALVISRKTGDQRGEGRALGNLGLAYADLGQMERAITYHEQALATRQNIGDQRGVGDDLGNLGNAYLNLGDIHHAIGYYKQALTIAREIRYRRGEGAALGNLGLAYMNLGDARRATEYYEQALTIRREIGDINGIATDSFNIALLYAEQGEVKRALPLAQEAVRIFRQIGSPNVQVAQQLMAQLQRGGAVRVNRGDEESNIVQQAFEVFQRAKSPAAMRQAVAQFPLMVEPSFIAAVEQAIAQQVRSEYRPAFEQRLVWLQQIAAKQGGSR